MTKVGQIIEEEIQQAIAETWRQADEKMEEARRQADEEKKQTAKKLLECGISIDQILQCIDGMTRQELEMMK